LDCARVLRSAEFTADFRRIGEAIPPELVSIQTLDPPAARPLRERMVAALPADSTTRMYETAFSSVTSSLDQLRSEPVEVVSALAFPIASAATLGLLGFGDDHNREQLIKHSGRIVAAMSMGGNHLASAVRESRAYINQWLDDAMSSAQPGGLLHRLSRRQSPLDPTMTNSVRVFYLAGINSLSRALGLAMLTLATTRTQIEGVPLPKLADEIMRYDSPFQAQSRACVTACTIGGLTIPAGAVTTILLGSANRDETHFKHPDRIVPDRRELSLIYGHGEHFCLGVRQARAALCGLLAALQADVVELAADPVFGTNPTLRGVQRLHVRVVAR
jgi:cytochrome P450